MSGSEQLTAIKAIFTARLQRILGAKLVGAYIYGAAAFPEAAPTGDIDFHVILREPLTGDERAQLEALHESLGRQFPPLGGEMDGYYILLADARRTTPPQSQMWARATDEAWALHRAHIHAGRCLVLAGPNPATIYPPATWDELQTALYGELDYVRRHLPTYPDYCILNLCRLLYSFETRDVVISKARAAVWAHERLPRWRRAIELAQRSYAGQATEGDRQEMLGAAPRFYEYAGERIYRGKTGAGP